MSENIYGTGIFNENATNYGNLSAAVFVGSAANYGIIDNGVFLDNSINLGIVVNNAVFGGTSSNEGTVGGDALFVNYSSNTGTVEGNVQKETTATVPAETVNGSIEQYNQPNGASVYGYYDNGVKVGPVNYSTVTYEVSGVWYEYNENGNSSLAEGLYEDSLGTKYYFIKGVKTNKPVRLYPYPTFIGTRAVDADFFNTANWRDTNGVEISAIPSFADTIILQAPNEGEINFTGTVLLSGPRLSGNIINNTYNNLIVYNYNTSWYVAGIDGFAQVITNLRLYGGNGDFILRNTFVQNPPIIRDVSHTSSTFYDNSNNPVIVVQNDEPFTGWSSPVYYLSGYPINLNSSGNSVVHDIVFVDVNNDGRPEMPLGPHNEPIYASYETHNGFFYQNGQPYTGIIQFIEGITYTYDEYDVYTGYAPVMGTWHFLRGYRVDQTTLVELSGNTYVFTGDIVANGRYLNSSFILPRNSHVRGSITLTCQPGNSYQGYNVNQIQLPESVVDNVSLLFTGLTSLEVLPSSIGGSLTLDSNNTLTSLQELSSSIGGSITIQNNNTLTSLEGLPSSIGEDLAIATNNSLTSLQGLPSSIGRDLIWNQSVSLGELNLSQITIGRDFNCSRTLSSLNVTQIFVGRNFNSNASLSSLSIVDTTIQGSFNSNASLSSLSIVDTTIQENFVCVGKGLMSMNIDTSHIYGNFDCSFNLLTDLNGFSSFVYGTNYNCSYNQIVNLTNTPTFSGKFDCRNNNLITLEGAPTTLRGFDCRYNKLSSLEEGPTVLYGTYDGSLGGIYNCSYNDLISLDGAPLDVYWFVCVGNELSSLQGGPQAVGGTYETQYNKLITLSGAPLTTGNFDCRHNLLSSLQGGPLSIIQGGTLNVQNNPGLTSLTYAPSSGGSILWVQGTNIPIVDDMHLAYDVADVQWAYTSLSLSRLAMVPPILATWGVETSCENYETFFVYTTGVALTVGERVHRNPYHTNQQSSLPNSYYGSWWNGLSPRESFVYDGFVYNLSLEYIPNNQPARINAFIADIVECQPYYS